MDNGQVVGIIWPFGYSFSAPPLTVYDSAGSAVVRGGDYILTDGWGPIAGPSDACGHVTFVTVGDPTVTTAPIR